MAETRDGEAMDGCQQFGYRGFLAWAIRGVA